MHAGLKASVPGDEVAAVEWQEDLDIVLTVPLEEGGGCKAQTGHQGAPLTSPPPPPAPTRPKGQRTPFLEQEMGPACVRVCVGGDLGTQLAL